ncbi:MAG: SMC-Scp complex subunit ScpB [Gammaproteobacteria bacterium]
MVGQREVPGRPAMYGTTKAFLDYFDLKSLDQLPPLAEIRELIEPLVVEEALEPTELDQVADIDAGAGDGAESADTEGAGTVEVDVDAVDRDAVEEKPKAQVVQLPTAPH